VSERERVLVTGANGFLGRHVLESLGDLEVHAVSRATRPAEGGGSPGHVTWHRADLLVPGEPARLVQRVKPARLLHLAWCTRPGGYWTSLENLAWVRSSLELFEAFARSGGKRALVAGTCAEYAWGEERLGPATPLEPASLYGRSKHGLHLILEGLAEETGISLAWARIFFVFGPGEPPQKLVSDTIAKLRRGEVATCRNGALRRDFVYVKDAARAFQSLLASDASGCWNVASGRGTAVKDVALEVARQLGRESLLEIMDSPPGSKEPPVLVGDTASWGALGWSPRTTVARAIEEMIALGG
jgi:nucleoside-diphosphate-sugar epimerase